MYKRNKNGEAQGVLKRITLGIGIAILITIVGTLLCAWLIYGQYLKEELIGYCAMVVTVCSSVIGCLAVVLRTEKDRLLQCAAVSLAYFALLLILKFLLFEGAMQGFFETLLLVLGSGIGVALLSAREKKNVKKYNYRKANR